MENPSFQQMSRQRLMNVYMYELVNYLLDILLPGDKTNCFLLKCSLKNLNVTAININLIKFKGIHDLW